MKIIGRQRQIAQLEDIIHSDKPEFVAVYGRRRIGKTFLIKSFFNHQFVFYATGVQNDDITIQLATFVDFINDSFKSNYQQADNWMQAFKYLKTQLIKKNAKGIVFIDELPWLDTKNSDLLTALDWFWNSWASTKPKLKIIVSGSAAAWMIRNLIQNEGGLYNRVTEKIKLEPFTLFETEQFLHAKNIAMDRYQITQLYMALGGIPFYLDQVKKGLSASQNIEQLCFTNGASLKNEFLFIFQSLFGKDGLHQSIIAALFELDGKANREELLTHLQLQSSGNFSTKLWELEESGFIDTAIEYGTRSAKKYYYISDFYTLFYLRFIAPEKKYQKGVWVNRQEAQPIVVWQGLAFEKICLHHIEQIKIGLQIAGIHTTISTWRKQGRQTKQGAQIDLIIDRNDKVINLVEIKFVNKPFAISKLYDMQLRKKLSVFEQAHPMRKAVWLCMLTTFGLHQNAYSGSLVQNSLQLNHLFIDA
jgi:uncharacterized protein